jgi:hypothetical protein
MNDPIDSAPFLLANPKASHQIRESLVSRLEAVNEASHVNDRFAGIRYLDAVRIYFYHHGCPRHPEILMD